MSEERRIEHYDGEKQLACVDSDWKIALTQDDAYRVTTLKDPVWTAQEFGTCTLTLDSSDTDGGVDGDKDDDVSGTKKGDVIEVAVGDADGEPKVQRREVTKRKGFVATVSPAWSPVPANDTDYVVRKVQDTGQVRSGAERLIVLAKSADEPADGFAGKTLQVEGAEHVEREEPIKKAEKIKDEERIECTERAKDKKRVDCAKRIKRAGRSGASTSTAKRRTSPRLIGSWIRVSQKTNTRSRPPEGIGPRS